MTVVTSDNRYGVAQLIVAPTLAQGANYTTIAAALTAASSGQTIFIRPGTYTENLTLKAGVNLCAFDCDALTPNVSIVGKATATFAGTCSISGIRLTTNSDFFLAVTGTEITIVNMKNCYLNCTNGTGISFTTSSATAAINCNNCEGNLADVGLQLFSHSSAGKLNFNFCDVRNTGLSVTASTASTGVLNFHFCYSEYVITTSGTNLLQIRQSHHNTSSVNTTALTVGGSGVNIFRGGTASSGTASAISIGSTLLINDVNVASDNTNTITGAGNCQYTTIPMSNTSIINTTTQTPQYVHLGKYKSSGQPSFLAYLPSNDNDVTGDGTTFRVGSVTAMTEVYDQDSNFNTNGTFTAPVTGRYLFTMNCLAQQGTAAMSTGLILITSNNTYFFLNNGVAVVGNNGLATSCIVDMDAADTASMNLVLGGSTKTVDCFGDGGRRTNFSGQQVA